MGQPDKVAIVTGAGRGIGEAIARELAEAGICVVVNDLNPDRAERVAAAINHRGGRASAVVADVANKFQCVHLVEAAREKWGQIDILVNYAAAVPRASVLKMDEWDWNRCFEVNLKGTFFMSQLCGRVMVDENGARGGAIVNVTTTAGTQATPLHHAAFCANSAGIVGFTKACAVEYAPHEIRVHGVLTDMETAADPARHSRYAQRVAATVMHIITNPEAYVPGEIVSTDRIEAG